MLERLVSARILKNYSFPWPFELSVFMIITLTFVCNTFFTTYGVIIINLRNFSKVHFTVQILQLRANVYLQFYCFHGD